jgi:pyruvate dehydrogenase E2 component (dihydrolipoamide acetyltransferase)
MPQEVTMPRLSDSMEEGTIAAWLVAEGDSVEAGQPLVEIETDKATMSYEAEEPGVVGKILVGEGDSAPLGAPIVIILADGEELPATNGTPLAPQASSAPPASPQVQSVAAPAPQTPQASATAPPAPTGGRPKASPLARRAARETGVALDGLKGTGPGGRIILADVEAADPATPAGAPQPAASAATPGAAVPETAKGATTTVELSRLQATVARRMAESRATVPNFDLNIEVDMTAARELREGLRGTVDPLPSYNDLVVMASAHALRAHPRANGSYRDGRFELHGQVNVGIAVAAEDALVVPTIADADARTLGSIAAEARRLAAAVRDGTITAGDLSGGTFTVSNLGMYGITSFNAVINPPQAAILAVGAIVERPAVLADGSIGPRPEMALTLACDHRILYGAEAAVVLAHIRDLLEAPTTLLVGPSTPAAS